MIKKIAILGSTGSIGKSLLNILRSNKKNQIILLSANKNYHLLLKQAKEFKVKNIIISDQKKYEKIKKDKKYQNIRIFKDFRCFKKILKKKNRLYNEFYYGIRWIISYFKDHQIY